MPRHTSTGQFSLYHVSSLQRPVNLIAQAVAILTRYGGSLWVSDPAYTFTGSDGTGVASDNSDSGYVRDLCATYGSELVPAGWIGINSSFTNQGLSVVKTANVGADTISLSLSGTAAAAFSDPINNLLSSNVPTNGGEIFELSAVGSESVTPAGAATKLLLVEMNTSLSYLRGTLVPLGSKSVVALGADCKFIRLAVYVGNWTVGAAVSASITLQKPSLRQIIGRPLFQATTGFKPKLRRVPKKLGPELAPATTSTAGWVAGQGGTLASDGSALTITNGTASEGVARFNATFKANTAYALSGEVTASVNGSGSFAVGGTRLALLGTGFKNFTITPSADAASGAFGTNSGVVGGYIGIKNVSVREVLEWGWAWVFDGVDDRLAVAATENPSAETLIVAYDYLNTSTAAQAILGKRSGNFGVMIRRENTLTTQGYAMTGTAVESAALAGAPLATAKAVSTVAAASGSKRYRRNGVQQSTTSGVYAAAPSTLLTLGTEGGVGAPAAAEIYAAAYIPGTPTDAEMLIIERAMGQVGGITI